MGCSYDMLGATIRRKEDIKTFVEDRLDYYPFGIGKPNDVASMLVYLLSKESRFISGQNFIIDSGGAIR